MPLSYAGIIVEHRAVRLGVGCFDVSHMGRLQVEGPEAIDQVNAWVASDCCRLKPGRGRYTLACTADGTIADDLIVYRISEQTMLIVCNAANRRKLLDRWSIQSDCRLSDQTEETAMIAIQGPQAWPVLETLGCRNDLARFAVRRQRLGPGICCTVARTGYSGEDGAEVWCAAADATALWQLLVEIARCEPCGLGARNSLRLEAALPLYGHELSESTDPFAAGLAWTVHLEKTIDFIGKSALQSLSGSKPRRRLVGLRSAGRTSPRDGYEVFDHHRKSCGLVTSGGPSPTLGYGIAMAYVDGSALDAVPSEPFAWVASDGRRHVPVEATRLPFYRSAHLTPKPPCEVR